MTKQREEECEKPSKSQKKREMSGLLSLVKELEALSLKKLEASLDEGLKQKIIELQRIKKGSAKKRQRQHIVKSLAKQDFLFATEDLARLKNSKTEKNQRFREIEILRERLLSNQEEAFESLKDSCPNINMRKMRTLINLAQQEDKAGSRTHYKELFKVLRNAKGAVC